MSKEEVLNIIKRVKTINKNNIMIENTLKNTKTKYKLGITNEDLKDIVLSIELQDYFSGPEPDRDKTKSGEVWIFKKIAYNQMFYIKFKFLDKLKVLSCHLDFIKE